MMNTDEEDRNKQKPRKKKNEQKQCLIIANGRSRVWDPEKVETGYRKKSLQ